MKRFPLLSLVALVLAVVYGCSDSTAPANSNALLVHTNPAHDFLGDPPPPPVDAAITITISSNVQSSGAFDGVYFNEGKTAWLRLDNTQPDAFGTSASANARFKASGDRFTGMGTLMIGGHEVVILEVTRFDSNPNCGAGDLCAFIEFNATVDGEPGHTGRAQAFDRAFCTFIPNEEGPGGFFDCGSGVG